MVGWNNNYGESYMYLTYFNDAHFKLDISKHHQHLSIKINMLSESVNWQIDIKNDLL